MPYYGSAKQRGERPGRGGFVPMLFICDEEEPDRTEKKFDLENLLARVDGGGSVSPEGSVDKLK